MKFVPASVREKVSPFFEKYKVAIIWIISSIGLFLAMMAFAGNGIAFYYAKGFGMDVYVLASFRVYLSVPILFGIVLVTEGLQRHTLKELPFIFVTAALGVFSTQLTFAMANYYVGPSYCALFQPLPTIITCLFGLVLQTEKISLRRVWGWSKLIGIGFAFVGSISMVLVNALKSLEKEDWKDIVLGNLLMMANAIGYSVYLMILKKYFLMAKKVDVAVLLEVPTETHEPLHDVNIETTVPVSESHVGDPIDTNTVESGDIHDDDLHSDVVEVNIDDLSENQDSHVSHDPQEIISPLPEEVTRLDTTIDEPIETPLSEVKPKRSKFRLNLDKLKEFGRKSTSRMSVRFQKVIPQTSYGPLNITFWMFCYASICYLVLDVFIAVTNWSAFTLKVDYIWPTLYVACIGSAIPLSTVIYSTKLTSPLFVASFSVLQLPATVILAWIFFQQQLSIQDYIGGSLIVVGLFCVIFGSVREKKDTSL